MIVNMSSHANQKGPVKYEGSLTVLFFYLRVVYSLKSVIAPAAIKSLMGAITEFLIDTITTQDAPPVKKEVAEFWFMSSSFDSHIQLLERFLQIWRVGRL